MAYINGRRVISAVQTVSTDSVKELAGTYNVDTTGSITASIQLMFANLLASGLYLCYDNESPIFILLEESVKATIVNNMYGGEYINSSGSVVKTGDGANKNGLLTSLSTTNKTSLVAAINEINIKFNNIYVDTNGNGDYTDIPTAIASITDSSPNNIYNVYIKEGTYNTVDQTNIDTGGLILPNYVNLIGIGNKDNIILQTGMTSDQLTNERVTAISVITIVRGNNNLENLTIIAENCRYGVHSESGNDYKNWKQNIKNCTFIHNGNLNTLTWQTIVGWGEGCSSGSNATFENCEFVGKGCGYLLHNNNNFENYSIHTFINCSFRNHNNSDNNYNDVITLTPMNSGKKDKVIFFNCNFNDGQITINNSTYNTLEISGGGNSNYLYYAPNTAYGFGFSDNTILLKNTSGSTIPAFSLVKKTSAKTYAKITDSNNMLFCGIALHSCANGEYCLIQTRGIISSTKFSGLTAELGAKYAISSGSLTKVTSGDYIAICKFPNRLNF